MRHSIKTLLSILALLAAATPLIISAETLTVEGDLEVVATPTSTGKLTTEALTVNGDVHFDGNVTGGTSTASGFQARAWGGYNYATDTYSTAWGQDCRAQGAFSTAWGESAIALGNSSTAWGEYSTAIGYAATAWGAGVIAKTSYSTALGGSNIAGVDSASDGERNWLPLDPLLEIGNGGLSGSNRSNALTILKDGRIALGSHSTLPTTSEETVQIQGPVLIGDYSDIATASPTEGAIRYDETNEDFEGYVSAIDGWVSLTSVGGSSQIKDGPGVGSVLWGYNVGVGGDYSTAWGADSFANGFAATAWGMGTSVGYNATAWGDGIALGVDSTAWGISEVTGDLSTAWGTAYVLGNYNTAWGVSTQASGEGITVWGKGSHGSGDYSTAWGNGSKAESFSSTAMGSFNIGGVDTVNSGETAWVPLDPLFEIGNGASDADRSNALSVIKNGLTTISNRAWKSELEGSDPLGTPVDSVNSSEGKALIVEGHAEFKGVVILTEAQGDISMGVFTTN